MTPDLLRLQHLLQQDSWTREDLAWLRTYLQEKGTTGLHDLLQQAYEDDLILEKQIDPAISARMRERLLAATGARQDMRPTASMPNKPLLRLRPAMAAASVLLVILTGGLLLLLHGGKQKINPRLQTAMAKQPILPGGNKATLELANGSVIPLDTASDGRLTAEGNPTKNGGQLSYAAANDASRKPATTYNLLTTPKGGQYEVILQDGTHVWLNSASSLRFPTVFAGKERLVEMTGEAYFEVAQQKDKPFRVLIAHRMQAEVLGTTLNVMAYEEEPSITTTLVEGSVRLIADSSKVLLKPGQEGRLERNVTTKPPFGVESADVESALAWKNGLFQFDHARIETIMRQIARWYDVDIEYRVNSGDQVYSGTMPRKENIDSLLKVLQYTGTVHFNIEGRKVVVTN